MEMPRLTMNLMCGQNQTVPEHSSKMGTGENLIFLT